VPMRVLRAIVLTIFCVAVVLPFVAVVSTSIAGKDQITKAGGLVLIPHSIHFDAYRSILAGGVVSKALLVSVFVTVVGTALSLLFSAMLAYGLSRPGTLATKPLLLVVLFSLLFTPGIIPTYLVVKQVGLLNSIWALIIPTMVSGFNVIVLRAFFMGIPGELIESARIDGASEFRALRQIVLPLSKAVLAVVGLFYAVGYWNAFFNAMLYINDPGKWPLQLVLRTYVVNNTQLAQSDLGSSEVIPPQAAIQMAILVISIVPILVVYPALQKHFTKGVLTGAVKA
jgi:multiple sugar transport system permease protein/putative aldouronate transport system permease protein